MPNLPPRWAGALSAAAVFVGSLALVPARAAADPTLDVPVMVALTVWASGTEPVQVELVTNGVAVATVALSPGAYAFEARTTGAALESITTAPLCTNLSARLVGGSATIYGITAEVTWAVSGVESHCLHDSSGGNCDDPWRTRSTG